MWGGEEKAPGSHVVTARSCCLEMQPWSVVLDGGPSGPDGCWWVVRIAVQEFDEHLCVVAKSSGGLEDEWDQVDAGVPVELFLLFAFGHVAWAGAGSRDASSVGREWRDHCRVDAIRVPVQVERDVHACSFGLRRRKGITREGWSGLLNVDLGTRVCGVQVGQASGDRGVALINTAPAPAYYAVELVRVDRASAVPLGGTDVGAHGGDVG